MTTVERIRALGFDYDAQPKANVTACNLCVADSSLFIRLAERDRYGFHAGVATCHVCGLVFLNPRMTAVGYQRFYAGIYRPLVSAFHGRRIDAHTIRDEQRAYAADRAQFLEPFMPVTARTLLDIGGSTGVVAQHFGIAFNLQATVLDPAPLEVAEAKRLKLTTIAGLVEEHDFCAQTFDVVTLCQTVDHLLDPMGVLARVRTLLSPDGILYLDIVDFHDAQRKAGTFEGALKIDHPYYFTRTSMMKMLRRAGFEILKRADAGDGLHVSFVCR